MRAFDAILARYLIVHGRPCLIERDGRTVPDVPPKDALAMFVYDQFGQCVSDPQLVKLRETLVTLTVPDGR